MFADIGVLLQTPTPRYDEKKGQCTPFSGDKCRKEAIYRKGYGAMTRTGNPALIP